MTRIHKVLLSEVLAKLPDIKEYNAESDETTDDFFICALGFEDRAIYIANKLAGSGYRADKALMLTYETNPNDNIRNEKPILNALGQFSNTQTSLDVDDAGFVSELEGIMLAQRAKSGGDLRVTIDISAGANRLILACVKVLFSHKMFLRIVYSEAEIYYPTAEEYQAMSADSKNFGLEKGVEEIVVSHVQPGEHLDPLPNAVILLPSFKRDRSISIVNEVDEALVVDPGKKVIWLIGEPRLDEDKWRIEAMKEINAIDEDAPRYLVSTFDYKDSLRTLDAIYTSLSGDFNITMSLIGSKLQAVGSSLFFFLHPGVRVLLAKPVQYLADHYSSGCKATWMIDFGSTDDVRDLLDSVGTLTIER